MAIPLEISADTRSSAAGVALSGSGHSSGAMATSPPVPNFDDILFITKSPPHLRSIQASIQHRPLFWLIQFIPLLLLTWILGIALIRFAKARGFGAKKVSDMVDYNQLQSQLSESTSARGGYYKKIEECLSAWQQQTKLALNTQPESVAVGYNALNSRCQWVLYGAPDKDRNAPLTDRETTEARQILELLSQHLR